jgi:hypothetical protein
MVVKKYMNHVKSKTPHHRRQHAVQMAGVFTALAVVVWITTLGWRFGTPQESGNSATVTSADQTLLAGVAASDTTSQTGLEVVSTSTSFSNF